MAAMRPVMAQLSHKIKQQAVQYPNAPYLAYSVPNFVFGYPLYDVREATDYVMEMLLEQGYQVWKTAETTLFISWMKPSKPPSQQKSVRSGPSYRPFVYDEAPLAMMQRLT
jgi:hypothetical protein